MIKKSELKGKYVTFFDKNKSERTQKVVNITGKTITVIDVLGTKTRIHPSKNKILGRQMKKEIQEINWND